MCVLGLGTDIVEIARLSEEPNLSRFAKRILTQSELTTFLSHKMPGRFLAKRFAAKEAAVKALGTGIGNGISWQHIEISNNELGQPLIAFTNGALERVQLLGATTFHVSIADEQTYAVATVILSK
jgi:holo-[acyl-carrier protein] synthase